MPGIHRFDFHRDGPARSDLKATRPGRLPLKTSRFSTGRPESYCWNCQADFHGRQLITIREAARYCKVSVNSIYRWMENELIEWIYNAGGKRRIYRDSLIRKPEAE